jgi:hypothetical protein
VGGFGRGKVIPHCVAYKKLIDQKKRRLLEKAHVALKAAEQTFEFY